MRYAWLIMGLMVMSGCLTRTYVVEKPRVDLEVKGNRGYLSGEAQEEVGENKFGERRKISVFEVELGAHERKTSTKVPTGVVTENARAEEPGFAEESAVSDNKNADPGHEEYVVQKGDTLQKISEKLYGTTKKYQLIYEANKEALKSVDKVYPGMKLRVPRIN